MYAIDRKKNNNKKTQLICFETKVVYKKLVLLYQICFAYTIKQNKNTKGFLFIM